MTFIFVYVLISMGFFVQNVLLAKEQGYRFKNESALKQEEKYTRESLRAFYFAPPVVPHEVESRGSNDCLRCHLQVTKLEDGRVAMQTPHPQFSNCLQCHVPSKTPGREKEVLTDWEGLEEPKRGMRGFLVSPPTVPHRIYLRENCLSCHGPKNPNMRLRTSHPERSRCLQCHVPNVDQEFQTYP